MKDGHDWKLDIKQMIAFPEEISDQQKIKHVHVMAIHFKQKQRACSMDWTCHMTSACKKSSHFGVGNRNDNTLYSVLNCFSLNCIDSTLM